MSALPRWVDTFMPADIDLGAGRALVFEARSHYEEAHRNYHDQRHLDGIFNTAMQLGVSLTSAQFWAVVFHDVIYVPSANGDNERLSALLMRKLAHGVVSTPVLETASRIILDTISHVPTAPESGLVLDLDLSGLGQGWERFNEDTRNVYDETSFLMDWDTYLIKRNAFFESLLARDRIYHTRAFAHLEMPARQNMRRAIFETGAPRERRNNT